MSKELPDKEFLDGIRETLDKSVDNLDEETLQRLRCIRLDVLENAGKRRSLVVFPRWITAGGFATVAVAVVAVSFWVMSSRQNLPVANPEDVEVLVIKDHLELYEEMDFYHWLAAAEVKGKTQ